MRNGTNVKKPATGVYRLFGFNLVSDYPFSRFPYTGVAGLNLETQPPTIYFVCDNQPPFPVDVAQGVLIYSSPFPSATSENSVCFYRFQTFDLLRFSEIGDFFLRSNRIDCHLYYDPPQHLTEDLFLGAVMSVWLELRNIPVLHASAVVINGQLVVFPADSGMGKSTLATALLQAGHASLFTDDILPLEDRLDGFWSHPGAPGLNLFPVQSEYFWGKPDFPSATKNALSPAKKHIPVGTDQLDSINRKSLALKYIYLPCRLEHRASDANIKIAPVGPAEAVIELLRHSYARPIVEQLGWQGRRLDFFARLVEQVPVRRLTYPSGFEHLPRVTEAVVNDLEKLHPN